MSHASPAMRIFERDEYTCHYCSGVYAPRDLALDHVVPLARGGDDSDANLVTTCRECNLRKADRDYSRFLVELARGIEDPRAEFAQAIEDVRSLAAVPLPDARLEQARLRMLHVSAITAMESFLAAAFIRPVLASDGFKRRFIETQAGQQQKTVVRATVCTRPERLEDEIKDTLGGLSWHNLRRVRRLYRNVLDVEIQGETDALADAVQVRHDIVHRNGKDKAGGIHGLTQLELELLLRRVESLVASVHAQMGAAERPESPAPDG